MNLRKCEGTHKFPPNDNLCEQLLADSCLNLKDSCATTVAELKVAGVGETAVNHLVTALEEIVDDVNEHVKE